MKRKKSKIFKSKFYSSRKEQINYINQKNESKCFLYNGVWYKKNLYEVKEYNGNEYLIKKSQINKPTKKYSKTAIPIIYIIECYNDNEIFIKVGYTTMKIKNRFYNLPYKYKVIKTVEINKMALFEYEQAIHNLVKEYKYYPKIKFDGYTECYNLNVLDSVLRLF